MQKLIIEDDEGKQVVVPLIRDEITIGRQEGNTIRLTEQNISRRHARIVRDGGGLFVEDLDSYNGIKLNGTKVTARTPLADGDQIHVGDYKLGVKTEAAARTASYADVAAGVGGGPNPGVRAAAVPSPMALAPSAARQEPVLEPMEGAPTIPVRTLADQGLIPGTAPGAVNAPPGRLVAISTPLAGSEFLLDRPSLVIGRTPENDVILNHKSISRHHAKVIRDGDRYVVVDLESANGVRVNGVEQERVDLESGDVIELGHVRLKFVAGDDPNGGNLGLLRFANSQSHKRVFAIAGGAAAVVLLAVVVLALGGSGDKKPTALVPAPAPASLPPPPPAVPVPAAVPAKPPVDTAKAAEALAAAKVAQRESRWDDSLKAAELALAADPGMVEALDVRRAVEAERGAAERLASFRRELDAGNFASAQAMLTSIPEGTRARAQAVPLLEQAKGPYVAAHVREADRLRSKGECEEARREAELVLAIDPRNRTALAAQTGCKEASSTTKVAVASRPALAAATRPAAPKAAPAPRAVAAAPAPRPAAAQPPPPDEAPAGDPDELLQQAQDAWLKGQFAVAIDSSRKALKLRPGTARAYQIIAVCSCSLKDQDGAVKAYSKLDDKNQKLVKALCQKSGVTVD